MLRDQTSSLSHLVVHGYCAQCRLWKRQWHNPWVQAGMACDVIAETVGRWV